MVVDRAHLQAGMSRISSNSPMVEAAVTALGAALADPEQAEFHPLLHRLLADGSWDLLFDSFYQTIPFGTGGRRGPVGIGPNRINPRTITLSVQGHVDYLRSRFPGKALKVVVAFDVRHYRDLRGTYPRDMANPLQGLTSQDLARMSAEVYAGNGVEVHMWDPFGDLYPSTPELSYAIRCLGADGGLNISASHNHPDDNGGKFYNERGGQEVPPHDEAMVDCVERVTRVARVPYEEARQQKLIHLIQPEQRERYLALNLGLRRDPAAPVVPVVFTNLHGVGDGTTGEVLKRAGYPVHFVESQRSHDGSFPGVPFQAPNPEIPASMAAGTRLADEVGAQVVLSCDPDADRIGAMCKTPSGSWRFLVGNELSSILCAYVFEGAQAGKVAVKTEVTTGLFAAIAQAAGAEVVGHLLVGCKYIAQVIEQLEAAGRLSDFAIGTEESHGFLLTSEIRDKDGGGAGLLLADLQAREQLRGGSLLTYLDDLYRIHGYYHNDQAPLVMRGAAGRAKIVAIQAELRKAPLTEIGGLKVLHFFDRQDEKGVFGPIVSGTDRASRDVLVFHLEGGHRVVIRPSGTEPKTKLYVEVVGRALGQGASQQVLEEEQARCANLGRRLIGDFVGQALARVGIVLPAAALPINGLVEVGDRIDFIQGVLPELRTRVAAGEDQASVEDWLKGRIKRYGKDASELVRGGFEAWLEQIPEDERDTLRKVYG